MCNGAARLAPTRGSAEWPNVLEWSRRYGPVGDRGDHERRLLSIVAAHRCDGGTKATCVFRTFSHSCAEPQIIALSIAVPSRVLIQPHSLIHQPVVLLNALTICVAAVRFALTQAVLAVFVHESLE